MCLLNAGLMSRRQSSRGHQSARDVLGTRSQSLCSRCPPPFPMRPVAVWRGTRERRSPPCPLTQGTPHDFHETISSHCGVTVSSTSSFTSIEHFSWTFWTDAERIHGPSLQRTLTTCVLSTAVNLYAGCSSHPFRGVYTAENAKQE